MPGLAQESFLPVIVLILVHHEFQIHKIPAGEGAGGLADVLLGVVADAHGEQLHDFAGEIFVGGAFDVNAGVQEGKHGGTLRHRDREVSEIAHPLFLKELQLPAELAGIADLGFVGDEVAMPE